MNRSKSPIQIIQIAQIWSPCILLNSNRRSYIKRALTADAAGALLFFESIEREVAFPDPSDLAGELAEEPADDRGQDDGDQQQADPVHRAGLHGDGAVRERGFARRDPAGPDADRAAETAGAHAGVDGSAVHLQLEDAGGDRAGDGGGHDGRNPDLRIADDVAHLEHGGAEALADKAAPAVFLEAHEGEADHIGAAARDGGAAGEAREAQRRADGGRGDRQRERDADDDGHENAHDERALLRGPHDDLADPGGRLADGRGDEHRKADADEDRDDWRDEDIHLRLLGDRLAEFGGDDRRDEHGERAARAADRVRGEADGHQ